MSAAGRQPCLLASEDHDGLFALAGGVRVLESLAVLGEKFKRLERESELFVSDHVEELREEHGHLGALLAQKFGQVPADDPRARKEQPCRTKRQRLARAQHAVEVARAVLWTVCRMEASTQES